MARTRTTARKSIGGIAPRRRIIPRENQFKLQAYGSVIPKIDCSYKAYLQKSDTKHNDFSNQVKELFTRLVSMIINGKVEELKNCLNNKENLEMVKQLLIHHGKDSRTGYDICEFIAISGYVEVLQCFFDMNLDYYGIKDERLAEFAIIKENANILQFLLRENCNYVTDATITKILYFALKYDKTSLLESLIENGIEIDIDDNIGDKDFNALHAFSAEGKLAAVQWLLENKANPNKIGYHDNPYVDDGKTALHIATKRKHFDIVKCLISKKADTNKKSTKAQSTPLQIACNNGHLDISKYLIEHGAFTLLKNKEGFNALEILKNFTQNPKGQKEDCEEFMKHLSLKMDEELRMISPHYESNLCEYYWHEENDGSLKKIMFDGDKFHNLELFRELVGYCINNSMEDLKTFLDENPVHINHIIAINGTDLDSGYRALDFAVLKNHKDIAQCLLQIEAKIEVRNP